MTKRNIPTRIRLCAAICGIVVLLFAAVYVFRHNIITWSISNRVSWLTHSLLVMGCPADSVDRSGRSLLMQAIIARNHMGVIRALMEHGADVDYQNASRGNTALHLACNAHRLPLVRELLRHQANPNLQNNNGRTPLFNAVLHRDLPIVEELLKHGANPNTSDNEGEIPLHAAVNWALTKKDTDMLYLLLRHGADVNAYYGNGGTVFQLVAVANDVAIAQILVNYGADINCTEKQVGATALHFAADCGNVEMVEYLLSLNADVRIKTTNGLTPIEIAKSSGHAGVVRALLRSR